MKRGNALVALAVLVGFLVALGSICAPAIRGALGG